MCLMEQQSVLAKSLFKKKDFTPSFQRFDVLMVLASGSALLVRWLDWLGAGRDRDFQLNKL